MDLEDRVVLIYEWSEEIFTSVINRIVLIIVTTIVQIALLPRLVRKGG